MVDKFSHKVRPVTHLAANSIYEDIQKSRFDGLKRSRDITNDYFHNLSPDQQTPTKDQDKVRETSIRTKKTYFTRPQSGFANKNLLYKKRDYYSSQTSKRGSVQRQQTVDTSKISQQELHNLRSLNKRPSIPQSVSQFVESSIVSNKQTLEPAGLRNKDFLQGECGNVDSFFDDISIQIVEKENACYNLESNAAKERKERNQRLHKMVSKLKDNQNIKSTETLHILKKPQSILRKSMQKSDLKTVSFVSSPLNESRQEQSIVNKSIVKEPDNTFLTNLDMVELPSLKDSPSGVFLQFLRDKVKQEEEQEQDKHQKQEEAEVNYPDLLKDVLETQKKLADLTHNNEQNYVDELNDLFKITKENLQSYKGFIKGIKHNLSSLNQALIKCESTTSTIGQVNKGLSSQTEKVTPTNKNFMIRKYSQKRIQSTSKNKSALVEAEDKLQKPQRPFSAVTAINNKRDIKSQKSGALSKVDQLQRRRISNVQANDEDLIIYGGISKEHINLPQSVPEKVRQEVINKQLQHKEKAKVISLNKIINPQRSLIRDQAPSISLVKSLQRINNEIQLFSQNLSNHCKENLKLSYQNKKNYESKAVGIGLLAQKKLLKHMQVNEGSISNKKQIESSSALLMDPLFTNENPNNNSFEEQDHDQKTGFIRSKIQYEHMRMYKNPQRNSLSLSKLNNSSTDNLKEEDVESSEVDDYSDHTGSKYLQGLYKRLSDKIKNI